LWVGVLGGGCGGGVEGGEGGRHICRKSTQLVKDWGNKVSRTRVVWGGQRGDGKRRKKGRRDKKKGDEDEKGERLNQGQDGRASRVASLDV